MAEKAAAGFIVDDEQDEEVCVYFRTFIFYLFFFRF